MENEVTPAKVRKDNIIAAIIAFVFIVAAIIYIFFCVDAGDEPISSTHKIIF